MIDAAQVRVSPCGGCIACGYDGPCAKEDVEGDAQTAANSQAAKRRTP